MLKQFKITEFKTHIETIRRDCYAANQSYFFFKKPNGHMFIVTDASGQFHHLAISDTEKGDTNGCGILYGIGDHCTFFDSNNREYNPIEKLCGMVENFEPFHSGQDERVLIDRSYGYSRTIPTLEWEYVLSKAEVN